MNLSIDPSLLQSRTVEGGFNQPSENPNSNSSRLKMMSNPTPDLQQRQKLHGRQNSTPLAFEGGKVPQMPPALQRPPSHRRGQSLDQQRSPIRRQPPTGSMVSITNLGSTPHGQQILREAQQQRVARPGQQNIEIPQSPQCGPLSPQYNLTPNPMYSNHQQAMSAAMQSSGNMQTAHSPYFLRDAHLAMSADPDGMGLGFDENTHHYFQQSHHYRQESDHQLEEMRPMSQPEMNMFFQQQQRPTTPAHQIDTSRFPLTPATTPFKQNAQWHYSKSAQSSPMKSYADETIKAPFPVSMQRGRSLEGIFEAREVEHTMSPAQRPPQQQTNNFDMAEMPVPDHIASRQPPIEFRFEQSHTPAQSSPLCASSPAQPLYRRSSPHIEQLPFFDETGGEMPSLAKQPIPVLPSSPTKADGSSSPVRAALSPRRMSISDLNLEPGISASIQETSITLDDIAQYIEGPDANDSKWICKFDDCNKRFGRKENIKSHVQTHLDDRQFQCGHCNKRFVRGHDLKRHAKIHTGTKPYPCPCGNAFARMDALTRHRQRNMCIGAVGGIQRKVAKRGRPRKHRPEMDERVSKASRTRKQANQRLDNYASSASSCSFSSWDSPPTNDLDHLSIRGSSPYDDMVLFGNQHTQTSIESVGLPPDFFTFTPPTSPGFSTGNKPSPQHHFLTPSDLTEIAEMQCPSSQDLQSSSLSELPGTPTQDHYAELPAHSSPANKQQHRHSPPSLSHSSSSPAADLASFDFSEDPSVSIQRLATAKMEVERAGADFDSFLDYSSMGLDGGQDSFFDGL